MGFHKPHIPFHIPHQYLDLHDLDKFAEPVNHNRTSDLPDIAWNPWMDLRRRDDIKATFLVTDYRVCRLILVLGVENIFQPLLPKERYIECGINKYTKRFKEGHLINKPVVEISKWSF